jgi:hypothetical protein
MNRNSTTSSSEAITQIQGQLEQFRNIHPARTKREFPVAMRESDWTSLLRAWPDAER